jgi:hypothetical protein
MLTAERANRATAAAQRRIDAAKRKEAKEKAKVERKQIAWELRVELPKHMRGINKEIKDAIARGQREAHFSCNYHMAYEVVERIEAKLTKRKFVVDHNYRTGEDNMGDFNAPCTVQWSRTDIDIKWGK